MADDTTTRKPRRGLSDVFYFLFQTLPVVVVITILVILTIGYGLVRLVLP